MHTYESIFKVVKEIGVNLALLPKKELKALPEVLDENERLIHLVGGIYESRSGVLCLTSKRLLFVDKGLIFGIKTEEFPFKSVSSVSFESGMLMGSIKIYASGNNAKITHVSKDEAKLFVAATRQLTHSEKHEKDPVAEGATDTIERLERLAALKDKGILSENEFEAEKAKLLG